MPILFIQELECTSDSQNYYLSIKTSFYQVCFRGRLNNFFMILHNLYFVQNMNFGLKNYYDNNWNYCTENGTFRTKFNEFL